MIHSHRKYQNLTVKCKHKTYPCTCRQDFKTVLLHTVVFLTSQSRLHTE